MEELESMSSDQLRQIAGVQSEPDLDSMPSEELAKIAGVELDQSRLASKRHGVELADRIFDNDLGSSGDMRSGRELLDTFDSRHPSGGEWSDAAQEGIQNKSRRKLDYAMPKPDPNSKQINRFINSEIPLGEMKDWFEERGMTFNEPVFREAVTRRYIERAIRQSAKAEGDTKFEETHSPLSMVPLIGTAFQRANAQRESEARVRMEGGKATIDDVRAIAGRSRRSEIESEKTDWRKVGDELAGIPGMAVDAAAGVPLFVLQAAVQGAVSRSSNQGGSPLEPQNFLPAAGLAGAEGAVLGSLGKVAKGVESIVGRLITRTATGIAEQGLVDVSAGALDEVLPKEYQTGGQYGIIGDVIRGEFGHAGKHLLTQAAMFGAMSAMHESFDTMRRDGAPDSAIKTAIKNEIKDIASDARNLQDLYKQFTSEGLSPKRAAALAAARTEFEAKKTKPAAQEPPADGQLPETPPEAPPTPVAETPTATGQEAPGATSEPLNGLTAEDAAFLAQERQRKDENQAFIDKVRQDRETQSVVQPRPIGLTVEEVTDLAKSFQKMGFDINPRMTPQKLFDKIKSLPSGPQAIEAIKSPRQEPQRPATYADESKSETNPEQLTAQQKRILEARNTKSPVPYRKLGEELGISYEQVRNLERAANKIVRGEAVLSESDHLQSRLGAAERMATAGDLAQGEVRTGGTSQRNPNDQLFQTAVKSEAEWLSDLAKEHGREFKNLDEAHAFINQELPKVEKEVQDVIREVNEAGQRHGRSAASVRRSVEQTLQRADQTVASETPPETTPRPAEGNAQAGTPASGSQQTGGQLKPKLVEAVKSAADSAKERLNKKYGGRLASGIDPTDIPDLAIYFAGRIVEKGYDFAKFTADAIGQLGESVKPHLQAIWNQATKAVETEKNYSTKFDDLDAQRASRGQEPIPRGTGWKDDTLFEHAKRTAASDPGRIDQLIGELSAKKRGLTPEESALLKIRQVEIGNELDKAITANDRAKERELRPLMDLLEKATASGVSQSAGALRLQQIMLKDDYTPNRVLSKARSKLPEGAELSETDRSQLVEHAKKIQELEGKLDAYKSMEYRRQIEDRLLSEVRGPRRIETRKELNQAVGKFAKLAEGKLFSNPLDPELISAAYDVAKAMSKHAGASVHDFIDYLTAGKTISDDKREALEEQWSKAQKELPPEAKQGQPKTAPRFTPKETPQATERANRLNLDIKETRTKIDNKITQIEQAQKPAWARAQDEAISLQRANMLTGVNAPEKIGYAGFTEMAFISPLRGAVAQALRMVPGVGKVIDRSPRYGGNYDVRAELVAPITEGLAKGLTSAIDRSPFGSGRSQIDRQYSENKYPRRDGLYGRYLSAGGEAHNAIKAFPHENEFLKSKMKREENYKRMGLNVDTPEMKERIGQEAYDDAERAIGKKGPADEMTDAFKQMLARWKKPDKNGQYSPGWYSAASAIESRIPFMRIPANIVGNGLRFSFGLATGSKSLADAMKVGIDNIPHEQADLISKRFIDGSIGAGLLATAVIGVANGFIKYDDKDHEIEVNGVRVPHHALHNPAFMPFRAGVIGTATAMKIKKGEQQGIAQGAATAIGNELREVPYVREIIEANKFLDPRTMGSALGQFLKSFSVPQIIQWLARKMDSDAEGKPIRRKVSTPVDALKEGIPGQRETLPLKRR